MDPVPEHSVPTPSGPMAEHTYASRDNFLHLLLGLIATIEQASSRLPGVPGVWPDLAAAPEGGASAEVDRPLLR